MGVLLTIDAYSALREGGDMYQQALNDTAPMMVEIRWLVFMGVLFAIICALIISLVKLGAGKKDMTISEGKFGIARALLGVCSAVFIISFIKIVYEIASGFIF